MVHKILLFAFYFYLFYLLKKINEIKIIKNKKIKIKNYDSVFSVSLLFSDNLIRTEANSRASSNDNLNVPLKIDSQAFELFDYFYLFGGKKEEKKKIYLCKYNIYQLFILSL